MRALISAPRLRPPWLRPSGLRLLDRRLERSLQVQVRIARMVTHRRAAAPAQLDTARGGDAGAQTLGVLGSGLLF